MFTFVLLVLLEEPDFELDKVAALACQSLIFQIGGRLFQAKQYAEAAEWFLLITHAAFKSSGVATISKGFRKAALCYIHCTEYAKASGVIARCPGNEASIHYVAFLSAAKQGLEDDGE